MAFSYLTPQRLFNVTDVVATAAVAPGIAVTFAGAVAGAGAIVAGVNQFDAAIGDTMSLPGPGSLVTVKAGAAFDASALLVSDATGRAVAAIIGTSVVDGNDFATFAISTEAASGADVYVTAKIR